MGKIARAYAQRARRAALAAKSLKYEVAPVLIDSYQLALQDEIYRVTPRPVTYKLFNSVRSRFIPNGVIVGHDSRIAPHTLRRRAMTGQGSYLGKSWSKDTIWEVSARARAVPMVAAICRGKARLIIGPGVKSVNGK